MFQQQEINWMNESIPHLKRGNGFYNLICFLMGKRKTKLSYKDMFLLLYGINRRKIGDKEAKIRALTQIISIYEDINGKKPIKTD